MRALQKLQYGASNKGVIVFISRLATLECTTERILLVPGNIVTKRTNKGDSLVVTLQTALHEIFLFNNKRENYFQNKHLLLDKIFAVK